jgi:hypothetical protein
MVMRLLQVDLQKSLGRMVGRNFKSVTSRRFPVLRVRKDCVDKASICVNI